MPSIYDIGLKAAENGANEALKYYETSLEIIYKNDNTPVTIADKNTEKVIRKTILSFDKNAKFVGEEGGGDLNQKDFWIIDPIDGTRNFARGIPYWKILIGYCRNGEIEFGLSYDPIRKDSLWAEKNKGAYLNKKRIKVSEINKLSEAYLYYGNPKRFKNIDNLLYLIKEVRTARSMEISSELLCTGKIEILLDPYGKAWDIIPQKIIIEEGGGRVTNFKGEPWSFDDIGCVASNGLLHDDVIKILNK